MAKAPGKRLQARAIGEIAGRILDPVLQKRAGVTSSLIFNWEAIAGARLASATRPEKVQWPRRASDDDPFEPATLTIAADPSCAFVLQHEADEMIARVNAFLGFPAIARIKIVQKPVLANRPAEETVPSLTADQRQVLEQSTAGIEDAELRESLARLGEAVLRSNHRK
jgi:hypothetical protein